jgi:UDP-N-acetyl-D-glucosamine dehydrogenase
MQTAISTPSLSGTTLKEEAITKLQPRTARVGIIGLGYVGLPLALLFVEEGFRVTGFDIDSSKIDMLASLRSYMCRIPQTEIALARDRGFQATTDFTAFRDGYRGDLRANAAE